MPRISLRRGRVVRDTLSSQHSLPMSESVYILTIQRCPVARSIVSRVLILFRAPQMPLSQFNLYPRDPSAEVQDDFYFKKGFKILNFIFR